MSNEFDRIIHGHEDSLGLNDRLVISADERDPINGGASHHYIIYFRLPDDGLLKVADIQFQHGPRHEEGSKLGATEAAIIQVLIDRLEGFQAGRFACGSNQRALRALREAQNEMRDRAIERARRGVLGKNEA